MQIDYVTYRITLLLYLGVLLFPIGFYFSYSAFGEIQKNTVVLNTLTQTTSSLLLIDKDINKQERNKIVQTSEKVFIDLQDWMLNNDDNSFYVGEEPLLKKYNSLVSCWKNVENFNGRDSIACYKKSKSLIFSLENMLKLKQNRVYNIFYINLFIAMAILLSLIFFMRVYIYQQLKKHAVYDLKTNLYTKEYVLITLKEVIAKASRDKEVLSLIYIEINEFKTMKNNSKKDKLLEKVGSSLLNSLRLTDVACRYGESTFIVILPNTKEEHFKLLTTRLEKSLDTLECKIKAIEHKIDETSDAFLNRINNI